MRWEGATVVVTGASRGIGLAVASLAASRGARVGLLSRTEPVLDGALAGATWAAADVADVGQLGTALGELRSRLGPVDVLVNNAGIGWRGPFATMPGDEIDRLLRVDLAGVLHATRLVLPEMLRRRSGHIVNVGSVAGRLGAPFEAAYSAAKFGVAGFTEALAVEVAPFGVHVAMVNPGPVRTDFAEAGDSPGLRRPKPLPVEVVAEAVLGAVDRPGLERVLPRWLRYAHAIRTLVPAAYTRGTRRAFAAELRRTERDWPRDEPGQPPNA